MSTPQIQGHHEFGRVGNGLCFPNQGIFFQRFWEHVYFIPEVRCLDVFGWLTLVYPQSSVAPSKGNETLTIRAPTCCQKQQKVHRRNGWWEYCMIYSSNLKSLELQNSPLPRKTSSSLLKNHGTSETILSFYKLVPGVSYENLGNFDS